MSSYLVYSKDPYLAEIFLEAQIRKFKPRQVVRYAFRRNNFREVASHIFNFSLFQNRTLYYLENAELLKDAEISFLTKLDFAQLQDTFIFHLESKTYWKILPKWEKIAGLKIKELKFNSASEIKEYLERVIEKAISGESARYAFQAYQKNSSFKEIQDAFVKASLYYPEAKEINLQILQGFLELREPPEIKSISISLKQRELRRSLETLHSLREKGYKERQIFFSLISRLAPGASSEEAEFILNLERKLKSGRMDAYFVILELFFYYCEPERLESSLLAGELRAG